ncbi:MAG: type II toxin-antitoxin system RelE/ParE family toxin [Gammaproteobacteria bacterium]|nr:type II toxin-antitoxin system RelE/ParE family toxin [Gammaproteobacteria bacterium]MYE53102.1 type II toxin-antitoxin system RelE/ParE family toxin [Gammaproteobacteria bacterium]MYF50238.1 type II toxin-antitoxin system RelE/ParE family toxin [Gammaproteobacteria bacterium]
MKVAKFAGSSLADLRAFPKAARVDMGRQIDRLQQGLDPHNWRPLPSVGRGVREIRIRSEGNIYRSMYVTNIDDVVYILHVFEKKSQRTPTQAIKIAKARLQTLQAQSQRRT